MGMLKEKMRDLFIQQRKVLQINQYAYLNSLFTDKPHLVFTDNNFLKSHFLTFYLIICPLKRQPFISPTPPGKKQSVSVFS